jgi:hypothetical protein
METQQPCAYCKQLFEIDEMHWDFTTAPGIGSCDPCTMGFYRARACFILCRECGTEFEVDMRPVCDDPIETCCTPKETEDYLLTGLAKCHACAAAHI